MSKLVSLCRNPISIVYVVYSIKLAKTDILLTMHNDILKILKCIEKKTLRPKRTCDQRDCICKIFILLISVFKSKNNIFRVEYFFQEGFFCGGTLPPKKYYYCKKIDCKEESYRARSFATDRHTQKQPVTFVSKSISLKCNYFRFDLSLFRRMKGNVFHALYLLLL